MSVAEIAEVVGATLVGVRDPAAQVGGKAEFDSRRVAPGDLFVAFIGEHADGHDYVAAARDRGAVAVMSTRPVPDGSVVVDDALTAMSALAAHTARRLDATVIGVTGSSGKTSTKDLIAQLLEHAGTTVAPPESFNNELGYPYTVLLADARTAYLVLETSARGIGHIRHLTRIAAPRVGVVLNVGTAHLGEFGSVAAIADAKGELVEALPRSADGGVAILNADDPAVLAMASRTRARILRFSALGAEGSDISAADTRLDSAGRASFTLRHKASPDKHAPVALRLVGRHHVGNALAAAAVAITCGMAIEDVAAALSSATPRSHWRMEIARTVDEVTIVNDAYNANPDSMRAALQAVADLRGSGRALAVLGPMAELGPASVDEHRAIGQFAGQLGLDVLIGVGDPARDMVWQAHRSGVGIAAEWLPDTSAAERRLDEILQPGDVVLVKGSRAAGMERVAEAVLTRRGRSDA
jgi:UDP-N-acetylmuramoyl-tripeptide--D-alanyl-D-alanine ligase